MTTDAPMTPTPAVSAKEKALRDRLADLIDEVAEVRGEHPSDHAVLQNADEIADAVLKLLPAALSATEGEAEPFQQRVQPWMKACFGETISRDVIERNHRFLEEALELVQSTGCTASEAHQLVDYVFGREIGETRQEIGGAMVTLAALCLALGEDMHAAGETELARIWAKVEKIRAKQAAKPKHSPLPQHVASPPSAPAGVKEALCWAMDEIDTLSNKLCQFAYPQGTAMLNRADQFPNYEAAIRIRSSLQPDTQAANEDDVIACLLAEKPFWFDPATNFVHADDGGGRGVLWVPSEPDTQAAAASAPAQAEALPAGVEAVREALANARNALRDIERARSRYGATGHPISLYSPDPASWMERLAEAAADRADAALAASPAAPAPAAGVDQVEEALERAAIAAYRLCAEVREVHLGDRVQQAIRAAAAPAPDAKGER